MNDKRKEYLKKWREDNKEYIRKYKKEYSKTHDSSFKKLQDKCKQLQQENEQLKDNWNKLRRQVIDNFNKSQDIQFLYVLQDMQELEEGSNYDK